MKRLALALTALACMIAVSAVAWQNEAGPAQGPTGAAPAAVLIELGVKDANIRDWSGRAAVTGARVLKRDGYRFRSGDELLPPDAWKASSHRSIRVLKGNPAVARMEPIVPVGVVLQLHEIKADAKIVVMPANDKMANTEVRLADILAGQVKELWNGAGRVRLLTTATPVTAGKTENDFPAAAYHPDGSLWVAYIAYTVKEDDRRIEAPMLAEQPADFRRFFTPAPAEQLFVRHCQDNVWSPAVAVTAPAQDIARCAIAVTSGKDVVLAYSARRQDNYDLFVRALGGAQKDRAWGSEERLTTNPGPDINPVMCSDREGNLWLACQSWIDGQGCISVFRHPAKQGKWEKQTVLRGKAGENCWHPAIAADDTGKVAVAFDIYRDGDYDVKVAVFSGPKTILHDAAATDRAEMRPSVAFQGDRLFVAYEEGPVR